jgi:hypothetical protein
MNAGIIENDSVKAARFYDEIDQPIIKQRCVGKKVQRQVVIPQEPASFAELWVKKRLTIVVEGNPLGVVRRDSR